MKNIDLVTYNTKIVHVYSGPVLILISVDIASFQAWDANRKHIFQIYLTWLKIPTCRRKTSWLLITYNYKV